VISRSGEAELQEASRFCGALTLAAVAAVNGYAFIGSGLLPLRSSAHGVIAFGPSAKACPLSAPARLG
jgi:hypothetical protein